MGSRGSAVPTHEGRDGLPPVRDSFPRRRHRQHAGASGVFAHPLEWHPPRIPGFGEMDRARFLGSLMETTYRGPVGIEVEDDTFGKSLEGRQRALKVAGNVLRPFFA